MSSGPETRRRLIAGAIGVVYAIIYGFWTIMATGGGHGNIIWLLLFIFTEFCGLYFPVMAVLAVDLRGSIPKIIFGTLLALNLTASSLLIADWVTEDPARQGDFSRLIERGHIELILFSAAVHFLPTLVFAFLLVRSIILDKTAGEDASLTDLRLS